MTLSSGRRCSTILISASTLVVTWKLLQWRARHRARKIIEDVDQTLKENGPLINYTDVTVRTNIVEKSTKRALQWRKLSETTDNNHDTTVPMVGQVGGLATHKKPVLTMAPDYILKPMQSDHRGIREIAFYEAIRICHHHSTSATTASSLTSSTSSQQQQPYEHAYRAFLRPSPLRRGNRYFSSCSTKWNLVELVDTVAMALAMSLGDDHVLNAELALRSHWRRLKREADLLRQLLPLTPSYYGVVSLSSQTLQSLQSQTTYDSGDVSHGGFGVPDDAHLLLQDLTANFSKPCVMDLKMGCQSYEPDAPAEKRSREYDKYPQQTKFGFRIVGMRLYDPKHTEADENGFRYFSKPYGRSLTKREELVEAFRLFFQTASAELSEGVPEQQKELASIRTRSISNLLQQLRCIRRWFEDNDVLTFYASSLLIIFEGDCTTSTEHDLTTIKMIDVCRVRRQTGGDHGYIAGLSTLKHIWVELLEECCNTRNER